MQEMRIGSLGQEDPLEKEMVMGIFQRNTNITNKIWKFSYIYVVLKWGMKPTMTL